VESKKYVGSKGHKLPVAENVTENCHIAAYFRRFFC